jgi:hypothetical protein
MKSMRFVAICVLVLSGVAGCVSYGSDDPSDNAWDISSAGEAANAPGAVVGRLWLNPNPIVFGMFAEDFWAYETMIDIANIGSEPVQIENITINGDPDFDFYSPPEEDRYPNIIDTDADCNGFSGMGFMLSHAETANDNPTATMTVHTRDPTSPTFSVPIYRDRNYIIEDPYPSGPGVANPIVKPNPIRINSKKAKAGYTVEICAFFHSGEKLQARTTRIETVGDAFAVEELTDYQGNPIEVPGPYETLPSDPSTVVISYTPIQSPNQDGALVIHFDLLPGGKRSLIVPILVR